MMETRGIRNNNPGNIRKSVGNKWIGRTFVSLDSSFVSFKSMEYGVRALIIILRNYVTKHNCNSIAKIISRYAPSIDGNNTKGYIQRVTAHINETLKLGILPSDTIPFTIRPKELREGDFNFDFLYQLCWAICYIESYYELPKEVFVKAYKMSLY